MRKKTLNMNGGHNHVWVEKYRPTNFDDIVLDEVNSRIISNILNARVQCIPNMLIHGPPGTGKTTSVLSFIRVHQLEMHGRKLAAQIIHLNASDERGVDVIRNQIEPFVASSPIVPHAVKFVVLDESDHLTSAAQHMLSTTIQQASSNVVFIIMCNFIHKIIPQLQGQFMHMHFGQLPKKDVRRMLHKIAEQEHLCMSQTHISKIQQLYKYDARSMINFIQTNQYMFARNGSEGETKGKSTVKQAYILHNDVFKIARSKMTAMCTTDDPFVDKLTIVKYVRSVCMLYTIDVRTFISKFLFYMIAAYSNETLAALLPKMQALLKTSMADEDLIYCVKVLTAQAEISVKATERTKMDVCTNL